MPPIFELQWNSSIVATIGTNDFGHYRGVASNHGFHKYYFNGVGTTMWGHCREGGRSSGVAIKSGSTVIGFSTEGMWNKINIDQ